ncbi:MULTISPECIES: hypothetical protein [Leptolyngbya]|nr:hypothetical protein [Leptolyngbya sp. FACHB-1624]
MSIQSQLTNFSSLEFARSHCLASAIVAKTICLSLQEYCAEWKP